MNRQWRQEQNLPNPIGEFWSVQTSPCSLGEIDLAVVEASNLDIESAAIAELAALRRRNLGSSEYGRFLSLHYSLLQNCRMTFLEFVKTRFIPEHVASKSPAGRTHYHAILKHILKPATVDALFSTKSVSTGKRLIEVAGWPYIDEVPLCVIETNHVQRIIAAAFDKGYSVQTVTHIRNVIGTVITHAIRRRCFSGDNPAFQVPLPPKSRRRAGRC